MKDYITIEKRLAIRIQYLFECSSLNGKIDLNIFVRIGKFTNFKVRNNFLSIFEKQTFRHIYFLQMC
jgi:hypothetical protein